jgi:hypothetical protein
MSVIANIDYQAIYQDFSAPIAEVDCGVKCSPYNERGIPFCCDVKHAVPTLHQAEWDFLRRNTAMWKPWRPENDEAYEDLKEITPEGYLLCVCRGHERCQREYRAMTCRSFPFFPYIDQGGDFLGLSYYWEYEDRCWIINNLQVVSSRYREQFISTFDAIFERKADEYAIYRLQSDLCRHVFTQKKRAIPLLHRDGGMYKVSSANGGLRRVSPENLPRFGVYKLAREMPFPDERQTR